MTAEIDNPVLEHLRSLRSEIKDLRSDMQSGFRDLRERMTRLESAMLRIKRDLLECEESIALEQSEQDRLIERIEQIERRLDPSDI